MSTTTKPVRRHGPTPLRRALDRALTLLARLVLRAFFREVSVSGRGRIPPDRPVLIVANHFNSFTDPVMLVAAFGQLPRFLAKSSLWKIPGVAPLCALAGMIPIHRPEDGDGQGNTEVFRACHDAFRRGETVAIFPEGRTHDGPEPTEFKTGAARIVLGAVAAGIDDLVIVPVGIAYDDKLALRSRVHATVGAPIDVSGDLPTILPDGSQPTPADRAAVRALTDHLDVALRRIAPNYHDAFESRALRRAAEIVVRTGRTSGDTHVRLAELEPVAHRLADAPLAQREAVIDALGRYQLDLDLLRLRDHLLEPGYTGTALLRRTIIGTVRLVTLALPALLGLAWNLLPYLIVRLAGNRVVNPITKGTVRLSVSLVVFPVAWAVVVLTDPWGGFWPSLLVLVLAPLLGLLAVTLLESSVGVVRAWRGWAAMRARSVVRHDVGANRARVVGRAEEVLASTPRAPELRDAKADECGRESGR